MDDGRVLAHIQRLFAYNWELRAALLDALASMPWQEAAASAGDGNRSLRDAFLDLLETEAYWAHHVVDGAMEAWRPYDRSDATSVERLALHANGTAQRTAERLRKIAPEDLGLARESPEEDVRDVGAALIRAVGAGLAEAGMLAGRLRARGVPVRMPDWHAAD